MSQAHTQVAETFSDSPLALDMGGDADAALPTDPSERADVVCRRLMEVTAELIAVLDRETSLLRRAKYAEIGPLTARKSALSAQLLHHMTAFRAHAAQIREHHPETVKELEAQNRLFRRSLEVNHETLNAMKSVTEGLIRTLAAKVAEQGGGPETYGADAALHAPKPKRPRPLSVNRQL